MLQSPLFCLVGVWGTACHDALLACRCLELAVVQVGIEAVFCDQLVMAALLDNGSVVHYKDAVHVPNGGEAMRDDDAGPARISVSMAFCISNSVRVSPLEVASFKIRMVGFARIARAMVSSCSCVPIPATHPSSRTRKDGHKKNKYIYLTVSGRELVDGIMKPLAEAEGEAFGALTAEEQDVFLPLFRKYADALGVFIGNITKRRSASA